MNKLYERETDRQTQTKGGGGVKMALRAQELGWLLWT